MAFTREMIERQIAEKMRKEGIGRKQVIDQLMKGAKRGAAEAEKAVMQAQDALESARAEVTRLDLAIASEGRIASNENERIALLNQIIEDDKKKQ